MVTALVIWFIPLVDLRLTSTYGSGYVTLFVINLNKTDDVAFSLGGDLNGKMVDQYLLTPHGGNITDT